MQSLNILTESDKLKANHILDLQIEAFFNKFKKELNLDSICNNQSEKKSIIVGFSGGADSTALLYSLFKYLKISSLDKKINLVGAHLNHNWRGQESFNDATFCREFCTLLNISFYEDVLEKNCCKSEQSARNFRYKFFSNAAKSFNSDIIFTAHNLCDTVETFIYRIIKGTSSFGLKSIPEFRFHNNIKIFRPFINLSREDIENYCNLNNLKYVFDSSNNNCNYQRNFIRLKILPLFKEINQNVNTSIKNLIENITIEQNFLDNLVFNSGVINYNKNLYGNITSYIYDTDKFIKIDIALQNKILADLFRKLNIDYNLKKINNLREFIYQNYSQKNGKIFSLSSDDFLFVNLKNFYTIKKTIKNIDILNIDNYSKDYIFNNFEIKFRKLNVKNINDLKFPKETDLKAIVSLPYDINKENIQIRYRQDGDIIIPFGFKSGKMKLKKYFINKYIPEYNRDNILLLADKNEILWAVGVGLSEKLKVDFKNNADKIYEICIKRIIQ